MEGEELAQAVLELGNDDPVALHGLFRYIYTAQYPPELHTKEGWDNPYRRRKSRPRLEDWDAHLDLLSVASKYELPDLAKIALNQLEWLSTFGVGAEDVPKLAKFVERAENSDVDIKHIENILTKRWAASSDLFARCFKNEYFRSWLALRPALRTSQFLSHVLVLNADPEFRNFLKDDHELAIKCVDKLTGRSA